MSIPSLKLLHDSSIVVSLSIWSDDARDEFIYAAGFVLARCPGSGYARPANALGPRVQSPARHLRRGRRPNNSRHVAGE